LRTSTCPKGITVWLASIVTAVAPGISRPQAGSQGAGWAAA
jgi:hypothetical protein